jgi:hypothetical protein
MTSTNAKMGGPAIQSYEKGGMVTKPAKPDMRYTGQAVTKDGKTADTYRDKSDAEWDYDERTPPKRERKRT